MIGKMLLYSSQRYSVTLIFLRWRFICLIVFQLYYHLNDIDKALSYALDSAEFFNFTQASPFVTTVVDHAIARYSAYRVKLTEGTESDSEPAPDPYLEILFNQIIDYSFEFVPNNF